MSIITTSYFVSNLDLPGRNDLGDSENLELFISKYETLFLRGVLGYSMAQEFIDAYNASISDTPEALPEKWEKLLDGTEYDVDGNTYKWDGLRTITTVGSMTMHESPIANYIYFMYRRHNETQTGQTGENKPSTQNTASASPDYKMVWAWNEMVSKTGNSSRGSWIASSFEPGTLHSYLDNNLATYPEWDTAEIDRTFFRPINVFGL